MWFSRATGFLQPCNTLLGKFLVTSLVTSLVNWLCSTEVDPWPIAYRLLYCQGCPLSSSPSHGATSRPPVGHMGSSTVRIHTFYIHVPHAKSTVLTQPACRTRSWLGTQVYTPASQLAVYSIIIIIIIKIITPYPTPHSHGPTPHIAHSPHSAGFHPTSILCSVHGKRCTAHA